MKNKRREDNFYKLNEGHLISSDDLNQCFNQFNLFVNDRESSVFSEEERINYIKLCVNFDNYFVTLASLLKFAAETENAENTDLGIVLKNIEKDLLYLQKKYTIIERDEDEN